MVSLNAISALTRSSLYKAKLDSGELAIVNGHTTENLLRTQPINASATSLNHHNVIQGLALTPSTYERKLGILRTKIEEKKCQFRELALGRDGLAEEKLDLGRALKRMDKLLELPNSILMANLHEHKEKAFDIYLDNVNRLLDLNPRELNYVLAATPIPTQSVPIKIHHRRSKSTKLEESEMGNWLLGLLPRWSAETNNFQVNKDDYFYLSGLPIVIQKAGLPGTIKNQFLKYEGKTLSIAEIEKLNGAAGLIVKSGWRETMNTSLKLTESVHIVTGMHSAGMAGLSGHPLLSIENSDDEYDLARTIIHEDDHYVFRNDKKFTSPYRKTPLVNHTWVPDGFRVSLIEELFTYKTGVLFYYRLLSSNLVSETKVRKITDSIISNLKDAKQAIELLEKEPQFLNEDGLYLLNEAREFWYGFEKDFIRPDTRLLLLKNNARLLDDNAG